MEKLLVFFCSLLATSQAYRNLIPRIINGDKALPGEFPFQVSLQIEGTHFCGGAIINENWIVTAAHCLGGYIPRWVQVAAGSVYYKQPLQKIGTTKFIVHEKYARIDSHRNDIALIKVQEPFKLNEFVRPVQLPEKSARIQAGTPVVVSGWGRTDFKIPENPLHLLKAKIHVVSQEKCKSVMNEYGREIYPTNICANDPTVRRGECKGDSGGPLTINGKLVGIVSWSIKDPDCASTKYPGIYTRVSEYVDWIKKNINQ